MFKLIDTPDRTVLDLIARLGRATRLFQQESVFCENLTFSQYCILDQVDQGGGRLGLAALHQVLEVDKSTTTRLVKPLTRAGLLNRERSKQDSRAVELALTKDGAETLGRVRA